jgi:uncharacterized protein YkwD
VNSWLIIQICQSRSKFILLYNHFHLPFGTNKDSFSFKQYMTFRSTPYYIVLLFILSCSKKDSGSTDNQNLVNDPMAVDILKEVNAFRIDSIQMPALTNNTIIEQQALSHSYDMAAAGIMSHDGSTARVNNIAAKMTVKSAGENVAYGYTSAKDVVRGWLDSPGHRANISGDYTLTGIGVAKNKNGQYYFTQIFIHP